MSNFAFLNLLGSMTEYYSNGLARMNLKADTSVSIQVDLNKGWYAHDCLCAYPRGDGLRSWGGGKNVRQVKTRIPGEAAYPEAIFFSSPKRTLRSLRSLA